MTRPVGGWELNLATSGGEHLPQFLRIARAIAEDARSGRLTPGSRLPGSRELARTLKVHRNTVLAAYQELLAEGFLETAHGRGTFLKASLPDTRPKRWNRGQTKEREAGARLGFPFEAPKRIERRMPTPRGTYALFGGTPDTRLVPREALARAYRRALLRHPGLLDYGDPLGESTLRTALAEMLRGRRGLRVTGDDILLTRGAQMALSLLGKLLVRPGDVIAVEQLGYRPAWRALSQGGTATLRPVAVDEQGLCVDALEALCQREPVRAVYVTPHHQYPTTVTMSPARRMALLALAAKQRIAIIEDDYDHEFHYEGRPVLPLASADHAGVVLYVGTLSKVFAPGPRVGYLIAPHALRDAAMDVRFDIDRQGDRLGEHALAELLEDGELQRHVRRTQRIYHARRDHMVKLLRAQLGTLLEFRVPSGGMALWATVDPALPVSEWLQRCAELGVLMQAGELFTFDARMQQSVRIGYAALGEAELSEAIARLARAAKEVVKSGGAPGAQRARTRTPASARPKRAP
jgi:GntR family transcriptional regulator/MocR family aminotransferase